MSSTDAQADTVRNAIALMTAYRDRNLDVVDQILNDPDVDLKDLVGLLVTWLGSHVEYEHEAHGMPSLDFHIRRAVEDLAQITDDEEAGA